MRVVFFVVVRVFVFAAALVAYDRFMLLRVVDLWLLLLVAVFGLFPFWVGMSTTVLLLCFFGLAGIQRTFSPYPVF